MKRVAVFLLALVAALALRGSSRPIGVFDSGIGGLSVLERLLTLPDLANEDFVYFGDQANMPYGRYDAEGKADLLRELVVRDTRFVLDAEGHRPSKIVVIACNTATAYGLSAATEAARPSGVKVIGVVNAGVEAALDALKDERRPYAIAVMATPGTISSGVYERTIRTALKERAVSVPVDVANRGGVGLAEAVENREPGMRNCARTNLVALVSAYRARGGKAPIKALILGCTHYPYVLDVFKDTLATLKATPEYASLLADDIRFVDPAIYTAIACCQSLRRDGLLRTDVPTNSVGRSVKAFLSVGKEGPLPDAVKYGRSVGRADFGTKIVPLSDAGLSKDVVDGIGTSFPASKAALGL